MKHHKLMAGAALCALHAASASAQQAHAAAGAASPAAVDQGGTQLQEIIVTAQKRSQKINDVGMAITAATGAELVQRNVTSVAGLTRIEPSLQVSQSNNGTPV